jgi:hypothetical protein
VAVKVKNTGTGRMPVEVAAVSGERFTDKGKPRPGYRDARRTVVLGAGEERRVEISCSFRPEQVVADPDVKVLQLRRKAAVAGRPRFLLCSGREQRRQPGLPRESSPGGSLFPRGGTIRGRSVLYADKRSTC